jgi:hypothetical protein
MTLMTERRTKTLTSKSKGALRQERLKRSYMINAKHRCWRMWGSCYGPDDYSRADNGQRCTYIDHGNYMSSNHTLNYIVSEAAARFYIFVLLMDPPLLHYFPRAMVPVPRVSPGRALIKYLVSCHSCLQTMIKKLCDLLCFWPSGCRRRTLAS